MSTFSILIASHGSDEWRMLAETRAYPSAERQGVPVLMEHDPEADRATVRNRLAEQAESDFLVFLDADDELDAGYVTSLERAAERNREHFPVLLTPRVSYARKGKPSPPRFWPEVDVRSGNWMVVGTAVPRDLFWRVGGWRHLVSTGVLNEYDDWDLWVRCQLQGATPVMVAGAIYIAHVRPESLHRTASHGQKLAWHREVESLNWPGERPRV